VLFIYLKFSSTFPSVFSFILLVCFFFVYIYNVFRNQILKAFRIITALFWDVVSHTLTDSCQRCGRNAACVFREK